MLNYEVQMLGYTAMTQLINKGGFRERANRSRKYKQSENEMTKLAASQYQPKTKAVEEALALPPPPKSENQT